MKRFKPPAPPYMGPPRHHGDNGNKPIDRITIHSTVSACKPGQAEATARYFQQTDREASAHYAVDPSGAVQCTLDSVVAYHAPPNRHSIGVELCDFPDSTNALRWADKPHRLMFGHAAQLVAELCLAYGVPGYYVDAKALRAGKRGVTTHAQVSAAFHETTHWDPGKWPRRAFMLSVRRRMARMRKAAAR